MTSFSGWGWQTCVGAAGRGHLEVLQWARANACGWNSSAIRRAEQSGLGRTAARSDWRVRAEAKN
eukprot:SAG22_NODE_11_length_35583_cov_107.128790_14_plen_65_part_00